MLKKLLVSLFLLFSSLTVLATSLDFNKVDGYKKDKVSSLALNQIESNSNIVAYKAITSNEVLVNLDDQKYQKNLNKPKSNSNDQSGWLLVFALLGFVMLSNRRGV